MRRNQWPPREPQTYRVKKSYRKRNLTVPTCAASSKESGQEFPEDVLTIKKEMDPRFEITTLVVKLEQERRFPILLFENVKGTSSPW